MSARILLCVGGEGAADEETTTMARRPRTTDRTDLLTAWLREQTAGDEFVSTGITRSQGSRALEALERWYGAALDLEWLMRAAPPAVAVMARTSHPALPARVDADIQADRAVRLTPWLVLYRERD
jgi:hypothetical protein